MSNHAIGYDMADVMENAIRRYRDKEISIHTLRGIDEDCRRTTCCEDGNIGEYEEWSEQYCGCCFSDYDDRPAIDLYDISEEFQKKYNIQDICRYGYDFENDFREKHPEVLGNNICQDCFEKLMDPSLGEIEWFTGDDNSVSAEFARDVFSAVLKASQGTNFPKEGMNEIIDVCLESLDSEEDKSVFYSWNQCYCGCCFKEFTPENPATELTEEQMLADEFAAVRGKFICKECFQMMNK